MYRRRSDAPFASALGVRRAARSGLAIAWLALAGPALAQGVLDQLPGNEPPGEAPSPSAPPPAPEQQATPPAPPQTARRDPCAATVAGAPAGTRDEQIAALRRRLADSADLSKLATFRAPQQAELVQRCFEARLERLRADLPRSRELVALADEIETFQHNWGGDIEAFLAARPVAAISGMNWWNAADEAFATLADLAVRVPQNLEPLQAARAREIEPLERELATFANEIATLKANQAGITTREDREKWLWILSWRANNTARAFDELELADMRRAGSDGAQSDASSVEAARAAVAEFQPELERYLKLRAELDRSRRDGALQDWSRENDPAAVAKILYLVNFAARGKERSLRADNARERAARAETFRERAAVIDAAGRDLEARRALAREWSEVTRTLDADLAQQIDEWAKIYADLRKDVRDKGASLPGPPN